MSWMDHVGSWLRDRLIRNRRVNSARVVALGFGALIVLGTLLLSLPIASRDGQSVGLVNSLFTVTSATCVTGLIVVDTQIHWTLFGQVVLLLLIQLGGLGFMTVFSLVSFALRRRIGLAERMIMASTFNLNDLDGVVRMVRRALMGTFFLEGAGAVLLSFRFVPQFGVPGGIWRGIFHAVSAFCNAGFDLMGERYGAFSSLEGYNNDPYVLGVLICLITVGGLGGYRHHEELEKAHTVQQDGLSPLGISASGRGGLLFFRRAWKSAHTGEYASLAGRPKRPV